MVLTTSTQITTGLEFAQPCIETTILRGRALAITRLKQWLAAKLSYLPEFASAANFVAHRWVTPPGSTTPSRPLASLRPFDQAFRRARNRTRTDTGRILRTARCACLVTPSGRPPQLVTETLVRLWDIAWSEFIPFLDYDVGIHRVTRSTNSIESLNARYRRAIKARGHFPSE